MRKPSKPTETTTSFFRGYNLSAFTDTVIPLVFGAHGRTIEITQVGSSSGQESWTMAAAFAVSKLNVDISAIDANPSVLASARRAKYPNVTLTQLYEDAEYSGFPLECVKYFSQFGNKWFGYGVRPVPALLGRVSFRRQNVQFEPLPQDSCDALISNNVFRHYDETERNELFAGMLRAVRAGGVIAFEGDDFLRKWTPTLPERFPVEPIPEAGFYSPNNLRVIG